jgi:hypothetical protein
MSRTRACDKTPTWTLLLWLASGVDAHFAMGQIFNVCGAEDGDQMNDGHQERTMRALVH